MKDRIPKPGEIYRHFKNRLYQIIAIAIHSETSEKMVVYQALYGAFKTYVRPLDMFISEVDRDKYPDIEQKYRFELVIMEGDNNETMSQPEPAGPCQNPTNLNELMEKPLVLTEQHKDEEGEVNSILLDFLEARSYEEKLIILSSNRKHMNDKLLNDMAASLDCTIDEGDLDERYKGLLFCLQTFSRFESNRLR